MLVQPDQQRIYFSLEEESSASLQRRRPCWRNGGRRRCRSRSSQWLLDQYQQGLIVRHAVLVILLMVMVRRGQDERHYCAQAFSQQPSLVLQALHQRPATRNSVRTSSPKNGQDTRFTRQYARRSIRRLETNNDNYSALEDGFLQSTDRLTQASDLLLYAQQQQQSQLLDRSKNANERQDACSSASYQPEASRRMFFGSTLIAAGTALGTSSTANALTTGGAPVREKSYVALGDGAGRDTKLQWQVTPVNKRTGVTVFDAEKSGYTVQFVTYLSRFLLTFDSDCQRWWYNRGSNDIPRTASEEQVARVRSSQFAAFSASVEVGLQAYQGPDGPKKLMGSLLMRYCPDPDTLRAERERNGLPPLDAAARARQERECKEARRQICLLFALMKTQQPVDYLTQQLAVLDNGSISKVQIENPGSGYAPGYGPPTVRFPPPEAGPGFERAQGRAALSPNGKILRVDVVNRGSGYTKPPAVTIAPPAAVRFGDDVGSAQAAEATAILFRSGPNKGRIERIQLTKPGGGYTPREIIRIRVSPPELPAQKGGVQATATAVLEYEVSEIQIVSNGTGYALDKPIKVFVEPPPLTARVNLNDPVVARVVSPDQLLPATTEPTPEMRQRMPAPTDPASVFSQVTSEASRVKGVGCLGRGCYDEPVAAIAYPEAVANKKVFSTFRKEQDKMKDEELNLPPARIVSAAEGGDLPEPINFLSGQMSSSSGLLSLLPAGVGLEFNALDNRYDLAVDPNYDQGSSGAALLGKISARKIDPDFGPRGRAPIERDMQLGVSSYLRFILSGAICCSGVHLALTPLDVVKTKVQSDPKKYPGFVRAFKKVYRDDGAAGFIQGWLPTFAGFFFWGGASYALTEFMRRTITGTLSATDAANFEVPIILFAAATGAFIGSFIICPFESVRIRSVSQKNYAPTIIQVAARMVKEEGITSLFAAVPLFLFKEVPFAMAKFTVFDVSSAWMYEQFPAAKEDLQLSLLVSLLAGTLGGIAASIVSNPADITITTVKKAKTEMGPGAAAALVIERGGPAALFTGLPIRSIFYSVLVSLQFLVYDSVRFALGIGSDDLKLYLDVLGGALKESGGPL